MTVLQTPLPVAPDDLLKMGRDRPYELVDGELVEKPPMGYLAGKVAGRLYRRLGDHIEAHGLGEVVFEVSFRCFPGKPDQVRRPDIAFIASARLGQIPGEGHVPIRPDLAVEIVSPGDHVYDLDEKLVDYRSAGVPLVWVVNPDARTVRVFRPGRPIDELGDDDTLTGDAVVPGFAVAIRDVMSPVEGGAS